MKMTFDVPDKIGRDFRKTVPTGKRSKLIAHFMENEARRREKSVVEACSQANRLSKVENENRQWEKFDDSDV